MPVEAVSLWPTDFGEPATLTPLAILRQQGAALGEQTNNIVVGRVTTRSGGDVFSQIFSVYCAPLGYGVEILSVQHNIDLYPANVHIAGEDEPVKEASDPEELKNVLKDAFARPRIKKLVGSLLAQSRQ